MCSETIEQVQAAVSELETRLEDSNSQQTDKLQSLRQDMSATAAQLREVKGQSEAALEDLRNVVHNANTSSASQFEALQQHVQVRKPVASCAHTLDCA